MCDERSDTSGVAADFGEIVVALLGGPSSRCYCLFGTLHGSFAPV